MVVFYQAVASFDSPPSEILAMVLVVSGCDLCIILLLLFYYSVALFNIIAVCRLSCQLR